MADTINCYDFESGWDDWWADNGVWEVGHDSVVGSHSGSNCAGTVLNGNYPNGANTRLVSPIICLPNINPLNERLYLRFWHWFILENGPDKGWVQVRTYGSTTWVTKGGPYTGSSGGIWSPAQIDLSNYAGDTIQTAFYFGSDGSYNYLGWYVDDVCVITPGPTIHITKPNGGERWCAGSTHNITWTSTGIDNVKIEYSTNGGSSWMTIVGRTPASSGKYPWTVPNTPSSNCKAKICDTDGAPCDTSDHSFTIDTCVCEGLALHSGWQWISTNIDPFSCEMESIFADCWDDLDIVIACNGDFCIPGVGCWIDCWNVSEMYKVHMAEACAIQVCGSKVPTNKPIHLPKGWNCIAYFPECPLEPEFALASIWSKLNIVKNDKGEFCIPGVGCWIDCLEYNEGYKAHLANPDTLIYPTTCPPCPPPFAKKNSFPGFTKTTHFSYLGNTGESYSIVVNSVELNGKLPEVGDEIGVFSPSGLCVGGGVWQGDILGMAVWQDDDRTEAIDGFQAGKQMIFKLWDKSENKETELSASFDKGDGRFGIDAYALVNLKAVSSPLPEKFDLAQNYPNPFNPETRISYALPEDCAVRITIYNMLGQKIKVLVDEHQTAGYKDVYWDGKDDQGKDVASAIYFYRIEAGEFTASKKMVILR